MRLISMSLWGNDDLYVLGAIENARLVESVYPGWRMRVYCDKGNRAVPELVRLGAQVYQLSHPGGEFPRFWRFWPLSEKGIDAVIVRDADSRLNVREAAAVADWLASGRKWHIMRDHPDHANWPVLAGMFGGRGMAWPNIAEDIVLTAKWADKLDDQRFLGGRWEIISRDMKHHSSVPTPHPNAEPFPAHPPYKGFVGEIVKV